MLDIQSFNESLKLKWIQGYLNKGKIRTAYHLCVLESQSLERSNLNSFTEKSPQMTFCIKQVSNKQIPAPFARNKKKPWFIYSELANTLRTSGRACSSGSLKISKI